MSNLGGYDENSFYDSNGVAYLTRFLQQEHGIKGIIQSDDKIPNLDGTIQLLEWISEKRAIPKQIFHVQVKTMNSGYENANRVHHRSQYKYPVDTKVFNVVKENITFDPVLLFLVDEKKEKVFWRYVSVDFVMSLDLNDEEKKTIYFSDSDLISNLTEFHLRLVEIHEEKVRISKNLNENLITTNLADNKAIYEMLQEEWSYLDRLLKSDLKIVTDYMYPDTWKFGIAFQEGEEFSSIGIYHIRKGNNDTFVKEFSTNKEKCFTVSHYKKDKISVREVLNEQISLLIKDFFKHARIPARYLPDIVLEEIAFQFLDLIAEAYDEVEDKEFVLTYYKRQESVQEVRRLWNALVLFAIVQNENLINCYAMHKNIRVEIDPLGMLLTCNVTNKKLAVQKFEECLYKTGKEDYELPYPLTYSEKHAYELYEDVFHELEIRKIKEISRVWEPKKYKQMFEEYENLNLRGFDRIETGYLIKDIYSNFDTLLRELPKAYKDTSKRVWHEMAKERMLRIKYSICYEPSDTSFAYYKLVRDAFEFDIDINEYPVEELKECIRDVSSLEKYNARCICSSSFNTSFEMKFPLYSHIWYLLNLEMWNRCSVKKPILDMEYI